MKLYVITLYAENPYIRLSRFTNESGKIKSYAKESTVLCSFLLVGVESNRVWNHKLSPEPRETVNYEAEIASLGS